jgi:hypothetical protein
MVMEKWYNNAAHENLPAMCQKGILTEIEVIEDLVDEMNIAGGEAAKCEAIYKALYAQTRLSVRYLSKTKLTVDEVESQATVQCEEAHLAYLVAQNKLVTTREALRAAQSRLDAWRSLAAGYRSAGG